MRRLAIGLLGAAAVLALAAPAHAQDDDPPAADVAPVDVLQVSGLFDEIIVDAVSDAITRAEDEGSQALVLQVNSKGAVVSDDERSQARIRELRHDATESRMSPRPRNCIAHGAGEGGRVRTGVVPDVVTRGLEVVRGLG